MRLEKIDHLVLTVRDIDSTVAFYTSVMGMQPVSFGDDRRALVFGEQKITVEEGPTEPSGATGPITSVYFRDPDGNLIEVSNRA